MIPKVIYQTWENNKPPFKMSLAMESWKQKNPTWKYKLFTSQDRINFLRDNFGPEVLEAYHSLVPGAFKADLFRYCLLYVKGGVYTDVDMICETSLDTWIDGELVVVRDDPMAEKWLANGFIASIPNRPELKHAIDSILKIVRERKEMFYLDYTGPALWGKSVNIINNRDKESNYSLGLHNNVLVLRHDYSNSKFTFNDKPILHTEYHEYRQEMKELGNEPYFNYVQRGEIFTEIPRTLIYTTYDILDVNSYMVNSFKDKNPDWKIKYFSQDDVDQWFFNSIYNDAYTKLKERGEKTDFFRYCYLYENGGVYVDADTYCNQPLDSLVKGQDLIVGLEALVDKDNHLGFDKIGIPVESKIVSICNWAIAVKPKHPILSKIINDIIDNKVDGVLQNTGPGRFSKWIVPYFGIDQDYTSIVRKNKSMCLPINGFGSNQSHSNSTKKVNPFTDNDPNIYITHMFAGSWRGNKSREKIKVIPSDKSKYISHNLTIWKTSDGYKGVGRYDRDTSRTKFMDELGDCRALVEFSLNNALECVSQQIIPIVGYTTTAKFEDFRHFKFQGRDYFSVSYIDTNWNTRIGILDSSYNFLGKVDLDYTHRMKFGVGEEVEWEKNWLFFTDENELYILYSTTPTLKLYKCVDFNRLQFEKVKSVENNFQEILPKEQLYWSHNTSTGGSSSPVWLEDIQRYVYLIHTKVYHRRAYNHFLVFLNKDLTLDTISKYPLFSENINYGLFFISSMILDGNNFIVSGGVEDRDNFVWRIPKEVVLQRFFS